MMARTMMIAIAIALAAAARDARADDPDDAEARRLAARAQVHFDLGEYQEATARYREAYRLQPAPGLLYNLGQSYRLMGDCETAATMYRSYLRQAPRSPYRGLVKKHLAALEPCAPVERPDGRDVLRDAPPPSPTRQKRIGAVLGVGGLALMAVGTYFGVEAIQIDHEFDERRAEGEKEKDLRDLDERGDRAEALSLGFLVAGGAAAAIGAVLYVKGWRAERHAPTVTVTPARDGAGVAVSWEL